MKKITIISLILNICTIIIILGFIIFKFMDFSINYNDLPQNNLLIFKDSNDNIGAEMYINRLNLVQNNKPNITKELVKRLAEESFKKVLKDSEIEFYNPYTIFYNEEDNVWIIYGSSIHFDEHGNFRGKSFGGMPYIFISNYDGKIIELGTTTDKGGPLPIK